MRYADTSGIHSDNPWHISPYRDWVLRAFETNMPFDAFTRAQLAGDLLPDATLSERVGAAYNRLNPVTREGGSQEKEFLARYTADRVRNVSEVWLATTMGCAECHDHKFDPLSTREFYSFGAFFADIDQVGVYIDDEKLTFEPELRVPSAEQAAGRAPLRGGARPRRGAAHRRGRRRARGPRGLGGRRCWTTRHGGTCSRRWRSRASRGTELAVRADGAVLATGGDAERGRLPRLVHAPSGAGDGAADRTPRRPGAPGGRPRARGQRQPRG